AAPHRAGRVRRASGRRPCDRRSAEPNCKDRVIAGTGRWPSDIVSFRGSMSRVGGFVVFLVVALSLVGGLHYYFWARLVRDTALPAPWRQLATGLLWLLGLSMPASMLLWRSHHPLRNVLAWPAFIWMGMILILTVVIFGSDVVKLVMRAGGGLRDPERRLAMQRVLGAAAATLSAGLGALALREGTKRV